MFNIFYEKVFYMIKFSLPFFSLSYPKLDLFNLSTLEFMENTRPKGSFYLNFALLTFI